MMTEEKHVKQVDQSTTAQECADVHDQQDPVFCDTLFHQKRKKGVWKIVNAPKLGVSVADTHAHLQLLRDPVLSLARAAAHSVDFICDIIDIYEDDPAVFDGFKAWDYQAAIGIRRVIGHPC